MIYPDQILSKESVAQHYNELDTFYREVWGDHVHHGFWPTGKESPQVAVILLIQRLIRDLGLKAGDDVCDVGCGYGATARFLSQTYKANVTALTISESQYNIARETKKNETNPNYLLQNWMANELFDESFDKVISIESLSHMSDKPRFFKEIYRVLRPGGRFAIAAWLTRESPKEWERRFLLEPICREGALESMGSASEYFEFMYRAKLKLIDFEDISSQVKKTWAICAGRIIKAFFRDKRYRDFLFDSKNETRIFAKTLFTIWAAYQSGSMRYGIFVGEKEA